MEGLLEEEVICFAQYFGVASRCQIYNQLLAQLWNWLLSKAPFWLSGYVVLVVVELCLNPWKTWVLWLIISVIMWKFISRPRLSLKSKSTCHYVTVWCIWFGVFKGRTNLREYWQWSAQGSSFLCVVTVAGPRFCFFAFKSHVFTLMPFYDFSVDDSWVNLQADSERNIQVTPCCFISREAQVGCMMQLR